MRLVPVRLLGLVARACLGGIRRGEPSESLCELLGVDAYLRVQLDRASIAYEGGVHPKHRLMRYHDFFVDRIRPGERVLDIGCGKGELAHDIAVRSEARVTGMDFDKDYLDFAREHFQHPGLEFVEADAEAGLPSGPWDVVILSNVLEHIDDRTGLLRRIADEARPERVLVRAPLLTRDWTVPLRQELGLFPFGDATHRVEYEPDTFRRELSAADLETREVLVEWGEIWAVAAPADAAPPMQSTNG
jgi:SAM-dependent methyltransferase